MLAGAVILFGVLLGQHNQAALPRGDDWLLRRLPLVRTGPLLTWGWLSIHVVAFIALGLGRPARVPFFLASLAVFLVVRAVFVSLMPAGPPVGIMPIYEGTPLAVLDLDNELFFSGHTAVPYLYALLSSHSLRLRLFFLTCSAAMGAGVLLTRNHYAIDVLGAYFVTHSIHTLNERVLGWLDAPTPA